MNEIRMLIDSEVAAIAIVNKLKATGITNNQIAILFPDTATPYPFVFREQRRWFGLLPPRYVAVRLPARAGPRQILLSVVFVQNKNAIRRLINAAIGGAAAQPQRLQEAVRA